jgi:hypothetical protein
MRNIHLIRTDKPDRLAIPLDCTHDIVVKYGVAECQNCGLEESKISKQLTDLEIERKEWKQECLFVPSQNMTSATICANCGNEKFLHTKQETLEEAATNYTIDFATMSAFKLGAKWQAERLYSEKQMDDAYDKGFKDATERMYSEEEVISLLKKAHFVDQNIYEWFSQNKKKKDEQ